MTPAQSEYLNDHVLYALEMIGEATREIRTESDTANWKAAVKRLAMHARALVAFFYGSAEGGAVVAEQFFGDAMTWKENRPELPSVVEKVARLTEGGAVDVQPWDLLAVTDALNAVVARFVELCQQESLKSNLDVSAAIPREWTRVPSGTSANVLTSRFPSPPPNALPPAPSVDQA